MAFEKGHGESRAISSSDKVVEDEDIPESAKKPEEENNGEDGETPKKPAKSAKKGKAAKEV